MLFKSTPITEDQKEPQSFGLELSIDSWEPLQRESRRVRKHIQSSKQTSDTFVVVFHYHAVYFRVFVVSLELQEEREISLFYSMTGYKLSISHLSINITSSNILSEKWEYVFLFLNP